MKTSIPPIFPSSKEEKKGKNPYLKKKTAGMRSGSRILLFPSTRRRKEKKGSFSCRRKKEDQRNTPPLFFFPSLSEVGRKKKFWDLPVVGKRAFFSLRWKGGEGRPPFLRFRRGERQRGLSFSVLLGEGMNSGFGGGGDPFLVWEGKEGI